MMGPSRIEVNLRRLLLQCELRAKENFQTDWRLDKVSANIGQYLVNCLTEKGAEVRMNDFQPISISSL